MKIYDRYYADSSDARNRYMKEEVNSRFNTLQKNKFIMGVVLGVLVVAEVVLICMRPTDPDLQLTMGLYLPLLIVLLPLCFLAEKELCDAWVYGVKDGKFLILNVMYKVIRAIAPKEVREIRILPAYRPDSRRIRTGGRHEARTWFKPMLEPQKRVNHAEFAYYPMAVLYTGKGKVDWNQYEDAALYRLQDAGFHELLQKQLAIVPHGENFAPFVHLLQNSSCPVIISRRMYDLHEGLMVQLFVHSGMDMSRLRIEEE